MDSSSQSAIITDENARDEGSPTRKRIVLGISVISTLGAFIGNIVTIVFGGRMLENCYVVAIVVMIVGGVLGLLQVRQKDYFAE